MVSFRGTGLIYCYLVPPTDTSIEYSTCKAQGDGRNFLNVFVFVEICMLVSMICFPYFDLMYAM